VARVGSRPSATYVAATSRVWERTNSAGVTFFAFAFSSTVVSAW
jgi:hypothetical protein